MGLKVKRAEREVAVCLDGSLVAEYERVNEEYKRVGVEAAADQRLNSPYTKRLDELKGEAARLRAAQEADTVVFRLRALPRDVWSRVVDEHPAREGNATDEQFGFDTDAVYDAALGFEDPERPHVRTIVGVKDAKGEDVEFSPATDWPEFGADLSAGQMSEFVTAVAVLNVGENSIPFVPADWSKTPRTAAKSK